MQKTAEELKQQQTEIAQALEAARSELQALERDGDMDAKSLAAHSRAVSRIAMLQSQAEKIADEIQNAEIVEAEQKRERLRAEAANARTECETIVKEVRAKLAPLFDYPGGGGVLQIALNQAGPVRDARIKATVLEHKSGEANIALNKLKEQRQGKEKRRSA